MTKNKKNKGNNKGAQKERKISRFTLPQELKKWILGILLILIAVIFALSFFDLAGIAGRTVMKMLILTIGEARFSLPLIFVLGGLVFLTTKYQRVFFPTILAILIFVFGLAGFLECMNTGIRQGGLIGSITAWPFLKLFGSLTAKIVFGTVIVIGVVIFWYLLRVPFFGEEKKLKEEAKPGEEKKPLVAQLFKKVIGEPRLEVKDIEPALKEISPMSKTIDLGLKTKEIFQKPLVLKYERPPLELLDSDKGSPLAGDTRQNSAIIKKTLENFDIVVEMAEINIGPTVTQYTFKPAEGVKLSKITALSNDLSLSLAAHPIRIEAPIPGKSLVGVEVPNKVRTSVRLRDLLSTPNFQNFISTLAIVLGRDVSGNPVYADLARMPHLLVAGSTGTGKTIFLNSLILSLLYQNSPQTLRLILVDPKRVEFHVYQDIPHLLCPVILDSQKTVSALKWLVSEMERRFEVLARAHARDISSYNSEAIKKEETLLPYIVLVVDELADLMAARGKEVEIYIVRLAQMARAVGIHLVVATQRPSVEVITGLIKANITSRVTFQVASQVDSRTVLDMAGAEKLLGAGDLLFISAEFVKPRRIQGAYVSEKEVRRVVNYIKNQKPEAQDEESLAQQVELTEQLDSAMEEKEGAETFPLGDDPLYEEAKKVVIESKKASASLLQRRLRIGYARAARLIDMLEDKGMVGPADGAKPREIILEKEEGNNDDWQKV